MRARIGVFSERNLSVIYDVEKMRAKLQERMAVLRGEKAIIERQSIAISNQDSLMAFSEAFSEAFSATVASSAWIVLYEIYRRLLRFDSTKMARFWPDIIDLRFEYDPEYNSFNLRAYTKRSFNWQNHKRLSLNFAVVDDKLRFWNHGTSKDWKGQQLDVSLDLSAPDSDPIQWAVKMVSDLLCGAQSSIEFHNEQINIVARREEKAREEQQWREEQRRQEQQRQEWRERRKAPPQNVKPNTYDTTWSQTVVPGSHAMPYGAYKGTLIEGVPVAYLKKCLGRNSGLKPELEELIIQALVRDMQQQGCLTQKGIDEAIQCLLNREN
jgi:hypothetical protein